MDIRTVRHKDVRTEIQKDRKTDRASKKMYLWSPASLRHHLLIFFFQFFFFNFFIHFSVKHFKLSKIHSLTDAVTRSFFKQVFFRDFELMWISHKRTIAWILLCWFIVRKFDFLKKIRNKNLKEVAQRIRTFFSERFNVIWKDNNITVRGATLMQTIHHFFLPI